MRSNSRSEKRNWNELSYYLYLKPVSVAFQVNKRRRALVILFMEQDFRVFDFHRIFLGDLPASFILEVIFRTLIMYSYSIVLLRVLGKRGMGQLSTLEVAIIIGFGTAVGDPMFNFSVPVTYGMISITVVAFYQIALERLINRNKKVEALMEGEPRLMVDNGIIQWHCMLNENLSKEDLFRFLRDKNVKHLGQIHKAFFEISGSVSVMYYAPENVRPGLIVLPEISIPAKAVKESGTKVEKDDFYSCMNCGYTMRITANEVFSECKVCHTKKWISSDKSSPIQA